MGDTRLLRRFLDELRAKKKEEEEKKRKSKEVAEAAATFEFESFSAMATIELKLSRTSRVYRPSVSPLFSICQLITNKGDN